MYMSQRSQPGNVSKTALRDLSGPQVISLLESVVELAGMMESLKLRTDITGRNLSYVERVEDLHDLGFVAGLTTRMFYRDLLVPWQSEGVVCPDLHALPTTPTAVHTASVSALVTIIFITIYFIIIIIIIISIIIIIIITINIIIMMTMLQPLPLQHTGTPPPSSTSSSAPPVPPTVRPYSH